jgi:hypothetical protein
VFLCVLRVWVCLQVVLAHIDREMDSDEEYGNEPAGLGNDPEGVSVLVDHPFVYHDSAGEEVVPDDDPVGPSTDPAPIWWPYYISPHARYKSVYGQWRKDSRYNSLMTPSEVPNDWTLQDRVRAYLTLNAFAPQGTVPSDSPEF